jgi:tetratricopeptide (TPR) repeat protein
VKDHVDSDFPGYVGGLERLLVSAEQRRQVSGGGVLFVSGNSGDGRTEILRGLADNPSALGGKPSVLSGAYVAGRYESWDHELMGAAKLIPLLQSLGTVGEWVAGRLDDVGVPFAGLLAEIFARLSYPLDLLEKWVRSGAPAAFELTPAALRRLAQRGPVVCVVDDAHQASSGGLWADLILSLGRAVQNGLPLLLVLGIDGPSELGPHASDEPDALNVARQLLDADAGVWLALETLDEAAFSQWAGPTAPGVTEALFERTRGRAKWSGQLWQEWQRQQVVLWTKDSWQFHGGECTRLALVDESLDERLKRCFHGESIQRAAAAREMLEWAAVEGRRFTPAAVADAIGRDPDELIDELDSKLAFDQRHQPDGVVTDEGWLTAKGAKGIRHVAVYEFARELDWVALTGNGLTADERPEACKRIAAGLERIYEGDLHRVARTLARLYDAAEQPVQAMRCQRLAENGPDPTVIEYRAKQILDALPVSHAERRRASRVLIDVMERLAATGDAQRGFELSEVAIRLAVDTMDIGRASFFCGVFQRTLGAPESARQNFESALRLFAECDQMAAEASARHEIARLNDEEGHIEAARNQYLHVLDLRRRSGDRYGEAVTLEALATMALDAGRYADAGRQFEAVLSSWRSRGDKLGEAAALQQLAVIDLRRDAYDGARAKLRQVLQLRLTLQDRKGEASTRDLLASCDLASGRIEAAQAELLQAVKIRRSLHDRRGEAATLQGLANVALKAERYDSAEELLRDVIIMQQEVKDIRGEAYARNQLVQVYEAQREFGRAFDEVGQALKLWRTAGATALEADSHHQCGTLLEAVGETERARKEFEAVVQLRVKLKDRPGEASARHWLGDLAFKVGRLQQAHAELTRAAFLWRELGDAGSEQAAVRELNDVETASAEGHRSH